MGKGDRKTRKGKIFKGSFGKRRLADNSKLNKPVAANVKFNAVEENTIN
jgi:ribosomal small subunit protein bTHX